jgi:hypothetical protein
MRRIHWLSLALIVGGSAAVSAQGFGYRYGGVAAYRFGPGGVVGFRAVGFGGGFYGYPYGVTAIRQVNVIYAPPAYIPPPIIITQPPVRVEVPVVIHPPAPPPPPPVREREADREAAPEPPLPGQPAGVFRPLAADNRARAQRPEGKPAVRPAEPPLPLDPPPPAPAPAPPPAPQPARPVPPAAPLPANEIDRLLMLGRNAFVMEEFGRAAEFFRRAAAAAPGDGLPLLLLGQALFALGKYVDAYDAVAAGVPLRPNWPVAPENPRDLYGPPPTEYRDHLQRLEQTLGRHPRDGVLLFLYGYQLWLDGRRDDARPLLERAREQGVPAELVDRFLVAAAPGRVL